MKGVAQSRTAQWRGVSPRSAEVGREAKGGGCCDEAAERCVSFSADCRVEVERGGDPVSGHARTGPDGGRRPAGRGSGCPDGRRGQPGRGPSRWRQRRHDHGHEPGVGHGGELRVDCGQSPLHERHGRQDRPQGASRRAGTVNITVTTAGGTSAVDAASDYTYANAPTVTALYGGSAPTTGGNTILIQGTNFTSGSTVKFATTAATSVTVLSSTQLEAVTPAEPVADNTVPPTIYNATVTTPSGTSPTSKASNFYWFGSGTCSFSGTGVENSGAPPDASAYIQGASSGIAVGTSCSGLSGLALTAPFIESMSSSAASVVTGTGPGGNGGNEIWGTWSGQNNYSATAGTTYTAPSPGYVLPPSGPSTTGGCPLSPSFCALAVSEGDDVYYGTDPLATCPPSQAMTDAGLVDCSVATVTANQDNNTYIASTLEISYANDPTPDPATATLSATSGLTPGQSVSITGGQNWWGAGGTGAPSYLPSIATGTPTAVPAPTVWIGSSRGSAMQATSNITVTPATYNCGSSGGASETSPGPVANCTLGQGTISGSFTVPSGLGCTTCNVYVDEPNLSLTQSTYGADGGTGSYNAGLAYDLVNTVESTPISVCVPTCGSPTTPPSPRSARPTGQRAGPTPSR